jgi:hypothetical protein
MFVSAALIIAGDFVLTGRAKRGYLSELLIGAELDIRVV